MLRSLRRGIAGVVAGIVLLAMSRGAYADEAAADLAAHLAALKDVKTLTARFECEKRLAMLETPLRSTGRLWIARDAEKGGGGVRFSTEKPYVSEFVLAGGKVCLRSEHETRWTTGEQSARPGLTAVMQQLGGWSTGEAPKLTEHYSVTRGGDRIPPPPSAIAGARAPADLFDLSPKDPAMAKAVKRITLAFDKGGGHLLFVEVVTHTSNDSGVEDVTRYWFSDVRANVELPAGVFEPQDIPGTEADKKSEGAGGGISP